MSYLKPFNNSKVSQSKDAEKSSSVMVVISLLLLTETMPPMFTTSIHTMAILLHLNSNAKVISKKLDPLTGTKMILVSFLQVKVEMFTSGISSIVLMETQG